MGALSEFEDISRLLGLQPFSQQFERTLEMRLDVTEDDKDYHVEIDMPGVHKDAIDVSVEGNRVTVSAEVKHERSQDRRKEVYSERYSGRAFRAFTLPQDVDSTKAEARYDGGVLALRLPKKASAQTRRLSIQ